jgi:hypothetical protein
MANPVQDYWKTFVDECLNRGKTPVEDVFLPALRKLVPPRTPNSSPRAAGTESTAGPSRSDGRLGHAPDRPSLSG